MEKRLNKSRNPLQHLFDAELRYQEHMDALVAPDEREGDLIGSGNGSVSGPRISGSIRWSMFSENCAYLLVKAGIEPDPRTHLCTVNPVGLIESQDGARIWFDGRGFGLRGYDPGKPYLWRLTMAVRFETNAPEYDWLKLAVASWHGLFDERSGTASYRACIDWQIHPDGS